jgi:hypothetical protein
MEDRSSSVLAIAITFMILVWVTVGLRCYVRYDLLLEFTFLAALLTEYVGSLW